jgi:hypothetical protein
MRAEDARPMDVLGWLWFAVTTVIGFAWSIVWFLLGGWVATVVQLMIVVGVIFSYKYGWRRAPFEMAQRGRTFGRFVWGWMRAREMSEPAPAQASRTQRRTTQHRSREVGDVNLSTLLSITALAGLTLLAAT